MLEVGSDFGPYRVEAVLGRGGMGMVYEATQLSLDRVVALKVVAPGLSADPGFRARFRREGPMQARIDHPHIVPVYEAGELEGHLFIAMRLVRGPTLKTMITARELDPRRSLRILRDVADALDTAHEHGLVHRDVKPSNVLVGRRDHAFLCDFGLTKLSSSVTGSLTKTGHVVGTLDYIAPEQIRGEDASSASDVYAFAAVLYETLTGQVPFRRPSEAALLFAHVSDPPPKVSELRPDLPAELDDVIAAGLAKLPSQRPASPLELVEHAEALLAGSRAGVPSLPTHSPLARPTVADTPREPPLPPLPAFASTVGDVPAGPPLASTETDIGALEPAVRATVTDAEAPVARPTVTDADAPVARPTVTDAETPVARRTATTRAAAPPTTTRRAVAVEPGPPTASTETLVPPPVKRRGRRAALLAGTLAVVAVAGTAGAIAGRSDGETPAPAPPRVAALDAGAAKVSVPATWQRTKDGPAIPGLEFDEPASVAGAGGELVTGRLPEAGGELLLTEDFIESLPEAPKLGEPVKLGPVEAYRYTGLRPEGFDQPLQLYVVPTDAGVIAVACVSAADGFMAACEEAASTLKLNGAEAFPLGPDEAFAGRLEKALGELGDKRRNRESALRKANTRRGQADAADDVAARYAAARRTLGKPPANPTVRPAAAEIAGALDGLSGAYEDLAAAARGGREKSYARARQAITRADSRFRAAVDDLGELGYRT